MLPLLIQSEYSHIIEARDKGATSVEISLDLGRSKHTVNIDKEFWEFEGEKYTYLEKCKDNTIYYWDKKEFQPVSKYANSLIKLIPTSWGAPTFQIDGVKMLPTSKVCPFEDAKTKVQYIHPKNKNILETCGGLGYFSSWCLAFEANRIQSYEINPDVLWIREHNPWSPNAATEPRLHLSLGDISQEISQLKSNTFDAVLHDPPRFALAGDLYSQVFYDHLSRVLKPKGMMFHYTGTPNKNSRGRDLPKEVTKRLKKAGFQVQLEGDGLICRKLR